MKLYLSPGACSLADHIALHEAGLHFTHTKVDLKTKTAEDGRDYSKINPKGYVPALEFDDGTLLTENIAILAWVADQEPRLTPPGPLGRYRLLEMLAFVSTEVHKAFKPFFNPSATDADRQVARQMIEKRLGFLADNLTTDYLLGDDISSVDAYLFVMLRWANDKGLTVPERLVAYRERLAARPAVRKALADEG